MPSHHKGSPDEFRALDAYIKLIRAAESVVGRMSQRLAAAKLTVSQFGALEALFHLGPMSQRALGTKLLKSSGNITMVVDNLEKRGLVQRRRDAADRRVVTVSLSEEGRGLIEALFPQHVQEIVEELGVLEPAEQEQLGRLCRKLGRRL